MLPMLAVRLELGEGLAVNENVFPVAAPVKVMLYQAVVAINENLVLADLLEATFDGYAKLTAGITPQQAGIDPVTLEQIVTIKEPAGGWRWETTGVGLLPQTIFGFAVVNGAGTILLAIQALLTPIPLTASGQEVNIGTAKFTFVLQPMA